MLCSAPTDLVRQLLCAVHWHGRERRRIARQLGAAADRWVAQACAHCGGECAEPRLSLSTAPSELVHCGPIAAVGRTAPLAIHKSPNACRAVPCRAAIVVCCNSVALPCGSVATQHAWLRLSTDCASCTATGSSAWVCGSDPHYSREVQFRPITTINCTVYSERLSIRFRTSTTVDRTCPGSS